MEKDAAEDVTELLVHDEDTAGGMMGTEYIAFPVGTTVAEAFARLRVLAKEAELITDVFVVGPHEELLGSLSLRDLLAADDGGLIGTIAIGAGTILIPGIPLFPVLFLSQVLNGLLLPFVLVFMILLINKEELMGKHVNGRVWNVVAWGTTGIMGVLMLALVVTKLFPSLGARH